MHALWLSQHLHLLLQHALQLPQAQAPAMPTPFTHIFGPGA